MTSLRLFISVNIDSPSVISKITEFQELFSFPGIKVVSPELLHFSLHFLGDTDESLIPDLSDLLSSITHPKSFTVSLVGCGSFPNEKSFKILWLGVSSGSSELLSLNKSLTGPLQELGFHLDSRPYNPHLTIARVKFITPKEKQLLQQTLLEKKNLSFGQQQISQVHLMQSTLTPQGPVYQSLFHKDL
jgi:2'-5' RNA ligase